MISASPGHVDNGVSLIDQTSGALDTNLNGTTNVAQDVAKIAEPAHDQSNGINEITTAVIQPDRSTQQNKAMFETTTAASEALTYTSAMLAQWVAGVLVPPNPSPSISHTEIDDPSDRRTA